MYSFTNLEPVCCSMHSSNCRFLTCIQISQEAGEVVWYSYVFQNFPQFIVIHTVNSFGIVSFKELIVVRATPPSGAFIYFKYSDAEWTFSFSICLIQAWNHTIFLFIYSKLIMFLISWLQSPSAVILEPQKIKSDTVSTGFPSISHEVMGPDAVIFVF